MQKCLVVVNDLSGNAERFDQTAMEKVFKDKFELSYKHITAEDGKVSVDASGFDAVAVCGGDGTLNGVINDIQNDDVEVFYFPCGTVNDKAKSIKGRQQGSKMVVGKINGKLFTYVAAVGTFTPIGYTANNKTKKKIKVFAYLFEVLKQYKCYDIPAVIDVDGKHIEDNFTLIMLIKSKNCFKFPFNRVYKEEDKKAQLLLIKSPKHKGLLGDIELFFPFFRTFFIGLGKERDKKHIKFMSFENVDIKLQKEELFNIDGEGVVVNPDIHADIVEIKPVLRLMKKL